jgi:hypothetical protein
MWHPFLWGTYKVYPPSTIAPALEHICLDEDTLQTSTRPLCLSRESWRILSTERLDSNNPEDVRNVLAGIKYAREMSGGLIFSIMSRDTANEIPMLRQNVEGMIPFFPNKVAVVVFENDSVDGSREAFKQWAKDAVGYKVDLISCGDENPDCKFHISHRDEATEATDYFRSSAIGKMADFRQKIVDHVLGSDYYDNYSHMIVLDMDLGVSISPLGILHTLGVLPDETVASAGRSVFPGSFGSILKQYDMSAFRPIETSLNRNMLRLHDAYCDLMPAGDRWHNQCDALSPMMLSMMLRNEWLIGSHPYPVLSAFNGAILYPMKRVRSKKPRYTAGHDGQQCEHIDFNMGMNRTVYVNPKWNMHLTAEQPGGPFASRAMRVSMRILFLPKLFFVMAFQLVGGALLLIFCVMMLTLHLGFPLFYFFLDALHPNEKKSEAELPLLDTFSVTSGRRASSPSFLSVNSRFHLSKRFSSSISSSEGY